MTSTPPVVGQDVVYTMVALDPDDLPANPVGVRFKVKTPSGTVSTYVYGVDDNVSETIAGQTYTCTFDASEAGRWFVRSEMLDGTGNVVGAIEDVMLVTASGVI